MKTDFWHCQPESEPWWTPESRFVLVDPAGQNPAHTEGLIRENGIYGAKVLNGRRTASFRFFPLDHNDALMRLLSESGISIQGQKWCEGMFHSKGRQRLVFVELKAWRKMKIGKPVGQICSTLSLLKKHFPSVLDNARSKRAIVSNRKHPYAYTARDRSIRRVTEFRKYQRDFFQQWGVSLEAGYDIEL